MCSGVFHGTSSEQAAQNIMREGFLVGGVDTSRITGSAVGVMNGSSYGNGVYAVSCDRLGLVSESAGFASMKSACRLICLCLDRRLSGARTGHADGVHEE